MRSKLIHPETSASDIDQGIEKKELNPYGVEPYVVGNTGSGKTRIRQIEIHTQPTDSHSISHGLQNIVA